MPLGLVVADGAGVRGGRQRRCRARRSAASWRSPACCRSSATERIRNVVFITGDVHYCAAHHYDPARAAFTDFNPFWEFVAGPAHAGTFGPRDAGRDVRPRSAVPRASRRHEAEPAAERRAAVLRHAEGGWPDEGADGEAAEPGGRHAVYAGAPAGAVGVVLASTHFAGRTRARDVAAIGGRSPRLVRLRLGRAASAWRSCPPARPRIWRLGFGRSLGPWRRSPPSRPCRGSIACTFFPIHSGRVRCAPAVRCSWRSWLRSVRYRLRMASRLVRLRRKRDHNGETEITELQRESTRRRYEGRSAKAREDLKSAKRCHDHVSVTMGTMTDRAG